MASSQDNIRRLLADARMAGPYLWSGRDVDNALLWFHPGPSSARAGGTHGAADGREFLRRLLHARGTTMPRPLKRKKSSGASTKKGKEETKRKRSRNMVDTARAESSPLQSVLMGYYQLSLPPKHSTADGNGVDTEAARFTPSDIKRVEMASSKLLGDLNAIVSSRRHTNEIYQAFINVTDREGSKSEGVEMTSNTHELQMAQFIEEYMTHPKTCTQRVYASSIFDRLLDLCRRAPQTSAVVADCTDDTGNSNPALDRYLHKLMGLASTNVKVQEVILLLLLEPVRRLQIQYQREGQPEASKGTNIPMAQESLLQPSVEKQQEHRSTELSPLQLSSFWLDASPETVERACASPPLPALVTTIVESSPRSKNSNGPSNPSQPVPWWSLPSPLLCAISQMHFPLACEYIRYWIDEAVTGHKKLYDSPPSPKPFNTDSDNVNEQDPFEQAVKRIKQFFSTSERLHLLGSHILRSMENESREESEMSLDDDDEDASFRKALAWKAIRSRCVV